MAGGAGSRPLLGEAVAGTDGGVVAGADGGEPGKEGAGVVVLAARSAGDRGEGGAGCLLGGFKEDGSAAVR